MNWNDFKYWFIKTYSGQCEHNGGCGPVLAMMMLFVFLLCGCATKKSTESTIDYHRIEKIQERMDSLYHATSTWQQSIFEKQTALVDLFKQSEVRDTSHTVFLNEKGDTTKEKTVIYIERNTEHSTKESEKELREEFFRQTDSILQVNKVLSEKMDSVLKSHEKNTVVEKSPSLFDKLKWAAGGLVLGVLGLIACATAFMRKR